MIRIWLASFVFVLLLVSPAHADIVIALTGPFSGEYASGGEQLRRGAEQAATDINAEGGVNGEKLVLRPFDDVCDPKQAVAAANQIVSSGIKFVAGYYCSGAAIPASKIFMEENVLMIGADVSNPKLTDEANGLVFRSYGRDDTQSAVIGKYILDHFRNQKIALVHDKSVYGFGLAQGVQKTLHDRGIKEIMFESFTPGERDYSALVSKLKQADAQVLFIGGYDVESGLITRQLKEQNANIQIIGDDGLTTNQFWPIAGSAAEGLLMTFGPDPRKRPEAKVAIENLRKAGYEPEGGTLYAYAAIQTLAEGIKRAGKSNAMRIAAALRAQPVKTVLGTLTYNTKGDIVGPTYVMYRWHNGQFEEVGE